MKCYKFVFFLIVYLLAACNTLHAEDFDPVLFEKHLKLIQTAHESDYSVQLENLFAKAKSQGPSIETVTVIALNAGICHADFVGSCLKIYPTEKVVSSAIKSGGDPEEVIKTAVLSDGDTLKIIAGAIAAGVSQKDAETMVANAMKLKQNPEDTGSPNDENKKMPEAGVKNVGTEELSPGSDIPIGGSGGGGGVASPS